MLKIVFKISFITTRQLRLKVSYQERRCQAQIWACWWAWLAAEGHAHWFRHEDCEPVESRSVERNVFWTTIVWTEMMFRPSTPTTLPAILSQLAERSQCFRN